ncbi:MAG: DUF2911 domain-containing protein [Bacteroidota bacterium]
MKKFLIWFGIIVVALIVLMMIAFPIMQNQTKKASPEEVVTHSVDDLNMEVFYCRPSKKGRVIFGELVPYGVTWRTGANEATTFTTSKNINFGGKDLAAGTYSLWTVPGESSWEVVLNSGEYSWGVGWGAKASRKPELDVLSVNSPVESLPSVTEMLTISFADQDTINKSQLMISWDQTRVSVPIN